MSPSRFADATIHLPSGDHRGAWYITPPPVACGIPLLGGWAAARLPDMSAPVANNDGRNQFTRCPAEGSRGWIVARAWAVVTIACQRCERSVIAVSDTPACQLGIAARGVRGATLFELATS